MVGTEPKELTFVDDFVEQNVRVTKIDKRFVTSVFKEIAKHFINYTEYEYVKDISAKFVNCMDAYLRHNSNLTVTEVMHGAFWINFTNDSQCINRIIYSGKDREDYVYLYLMYRNDGRLIHIAFMITNYFDIWNSEINEWYLFWKKNNVEELQKRLYLIAEK